MSVPEDVLIDILSSFSAESVIRFRCVSKYWSSLTQSPDFIAAYLSRSNSNKKDDDDDVSLVCSRGDEFTGKLVCISGSDFMVLKEAEIPLKVRDQDNRQDVCWPLYGSCNGILCVTSDRHGGGIPLWNPAIGQVKLVPLMGRSWPLERHRGFFSTAFGYDSKTNDYKILRLIQFEDDERDSDIRYAYLYSLAADSWKELHPFPMIHVCKPKEYINGVFYWAGLSETLMDVIISFEMVDEKFHELALPTLHFFFWSLCNLKGSLVFCGYGNENDLHIWVLNPDGESWTRLPKITLSFQLSHPIAPIALGQRKHDELIFIEFSNAIILFDPQTQ